MTHTADDMHDDSPVSRPMTIDSKALEAARAAYNRYASHDASSSGLLNAITAYLAALPSPKVEGLVTALERAHAVLLAEGFDAHAAEANRALIAYRSTPPAVTP